MKAVLRARMLDWLLIRLSVVVFAVVGRRYLVLGRVNRFGHYGLAFQRIGNSCQAVTRGFKIMDKGNADKPFAGIIAIFIGD